MENITQGQWFRGPSADLGETIEQSLRFNTGGYLKLAQDSSGDGLISGNRTWTFSTWFKHGDMGETNIFGFHSTSQNNWILSWASGSSYDTFLSRDHTGWQNYDTTQKFRDTAAWYHVFITCSSGVMTMRVNNVARGGTVTQNHSMDRDFVIGAEHTNGGSPMDGYLADTYFIQGTVMNAVNDGFIRLNEDGIYVPDTPTISSYGTNGWHLTYDSSQSNGIGHDSSGNNNHFTVSGFDTTAISSSNFDNDIDYNDTPTSNYGTANPNGTTVSDFSEGNLFVDTSSNGTWQGAYGSFPMQSGKWYWEVEANQSDMMIGISRNHRAAPTYASQEGEIAYRGDGKKWENGSAESYGNTYTTGDVIGVAFDADNGNIWFSKNDTWQNSGNPANGTNAAYTSLADAIYVPAHFNVDTGGQRINYGQRAFEGTKPSGFEALNTNKLAEPTVKNGKDHFDVVTWTGDGTEGRDITGLNFQPDFVWLKARSIAYHNRLYDVIRGTTVSLITDQDYVDQTSSTSLTAFNSDGFEIGTGVGYNDDTRTYVGWCWKAGGTAVSNSDGSISSNVSANTDAGFSIVSYTGTGANATVGHGLNSAPEFMIVKNRDTAANWIVYHTELDSTSPEDYILVLNSTGARTDNHEMWNDTAPTNSVFSVGTANHTNKSGDDMIAYCWHSVEGYSKFGIYTGNASSDGPFIYTGFKPALVVIKAQTQIEDWFVHDNGRYPNNPSQKIMRWNKSDAESGTGNDIDLLSNGFKIRTTNNDTNRADPLVYMAWAEHPFGGANTPPVTAR